MYRSTLFRSASLALVLLLLLPLLQGCTDSGNGSDGITLAATLFPVYDFARTIAAGTDTTVTLLLPPGMESHSFEPSPADIITVSRADVFAYTGEYMEKWAEKILDGLDGAQGEADGFRTVGELLIADCSRDIPLDEVAHVHEEGSHSHGNYDPHIWTDPAAAAKMAETIAEALIAKDAANAETYRSNLAAFKAELQALDEAFFALTETAARKDICFGGRFAMHYFAKRYGLNCISAYDSCSAETEPSAKAVAEITDAITKGGIGVIYYEELADPKVARAIAAETGCKMLLLHSCHNLSKEDFDAGKTYLSLMYDNLANLKVGLL
ncbi:MAG: zinc ABC transporter substrate-binding protein [Clostridiales bacterium]|nr:zinc ABC transporter substrate-binding protein [Clostridiales bacterium]